MNTEDLDRLVALMRPVLDATALRTARITAETITLVEEGLEAMSGPRPNFDRLLQRASWESPIRVEEFSLAAATGAELTCGELQPGRYTVTIAEEAGRRAEIEIQPQKQALRLRFLKGDPLRLAREPQRYLTRNHWVILNAAASTSLDLLFRTELFFEDAELDPSE